jgi:2-dehydro-3-deoxy-D-arabinonate dehydratase
MEESEEEEAKDFYDRVYDAERPELFMKATPHRTVGPGEDVAIRADSNWSVPEPELAVAVGSDGDVLGYTIGNDMSARDIEGENPLYLPQAKVYDRCCALGPYIRLPGDMSPTDGQIELTITRNGEAVFEGATSLSRLKRSVEELIGYLFRHNSFPHGCLLLTGTGIVPPDAFALNEGDDVRISIDGLGTLRNRVALSPGSDRADE